MDDLEVRKLRGERSRYPGACMSRMDTHLSASWLRFFRGISIFNKPLSLI